MRSLLPSRLMNERWLGLGLARPGREDGKHDPDHKCGVNDRDDSLSPKQAMSTNEGYDVARCG